MQIVEIIPFNNFKEKIRLIKEYMRIGKVFAEENYICVERMEG